HVKDKRVFNFSDSLMLAIQKSSAFAMEVHPDSLVRDLFDAMQKQDSTHDLHKMLNDKEYASLSKKFEEKHGYKMHDNMNPLLAESMLKKEYSKPGDKDSFIDAYLYGIARTMDKTIYGLENTSQQFNKLIGSPDEIKDRLLGLLETGDGEDDSEEMIKIYSTGNLDNILNYINKYNVVDSELMARNKVMARNIINDTKHGSLLAAVGAAHLPGDDGIISLLRKEGYTLTPVPATFTGVADKYHIDYDQMKWVTHTDYEMGYSVDFPSEPIKTNIYANLTTWIYPDIANENFYGIYVLPKGTKTDPANREKVINKVIQNFAKNKKNQIISRKNTFINGLPCTDFIVKNSTGYQRSVLLVNNNILYYMYMGRHLKSLHSAYANRFFNSFKGFNITEKPAKEWINFKNDTGAFSVNLPLQPSRLTQVVKNPDKASLPFKINMFVATDTPRLLNYLIRYNDYPAGNYLADRNALFNSLNKEFAGKVQVVGNARTIWKGEFEGREIDVIFQGGYHGVMQVYVRGNRFYMLLKQNSHEDEKVDANDPFFNSFTFNPYTKIDYVDFEPQGETYKAKLVSQPKIVTDTTKGYTSYLQNGKYYISTSPASGGVYTLEHYNISKYYHTTHIDSLYKDLIRLSISKYTDTTLKVDTVMMNGKKAREIVVENNTSHDQRRFRILVDDGEVFIFQGRVASKELFNEESNTFYTSLERTGTTPKNDLFSSKSSVIMDGLQSSDTCEYNHALGALSYYKFAPDELPSIYTALQKSYADDTTLDGARYKLIKTLKDVHNESTIGELQKLYGNLKGQDLLKSIVLRTITDADPKNGYDIYFNLLITDTLVQPKTTTSIFNPLYDSLKYASDHFEKIIPLVSHTSYRDDILLLAQKMIEQKDDNYAKLIKSNFKPLTAFAYKDLDSFLASKDTNKSEWTAGLYKYLYLMSEVKGEPLTNQFTNYYITHNPKGNYISTAVIARINNHLPTNPVLINRLMDSIDSRYDVMEALYRQKQAEKIPAKYRKQDEFAKLCLYQYIGTDDYGYPVNLKLLGSVSDKGMLYYAYKFDLPERTEGETYIGIVGPYKPGSPKLNFDKYSAYTDYDIKSVNWMKQAKKMIPDLKQAYKSN
ncbi:MAG TPA: TraB/GumN family protein, partial [Mucilaginibacter sp.]|nr:TraB/GumN family protein [Mucilaginibacter sp.]